MADTPLPPISGKAWKLMEALASAHDPPFDSGRHNWRECRLCLAEQELGAPGNGEALMREVWQHLQRCPHE